eukprot:TRINITY_DN76281_c0_g1_i1.p1 TRINITY_DN76281_c0_g1~~TRINITY_DN76281_c0_g1_i1.p1  ORF type:complete len:250 (+),score=33.06 TRINITY_DN76281_c0_g1_i1:138-887(+)
MADGGEHAATESGAAPPQKKEDPLAGVKAALDAQMRRPVYERFSSMYEGEEFDQTRFNALVPWGRDQTFSGLTRGTHKGPHTPHGWGVLEHHEGFMQICSMWEDGVPGGSGMWLNVAHGAQQCGYGTWLAGKRDGYFALVKEGGVFLEEYDMGQLKRRIKWRKDKLHKTCVRCGALFVPSANTSAEKFCRFHLKQVDIEGRYPCCGALQSVNPRGCTTSMHVEPESEELQGPTYAATPEDGYGRAVPFP